jgi:hypothetical protein
VKLISQVYYVGIDLARGKSGFAVLDKDLNLLFLGKIADKEIISRTDALSEALVAIDAPLSMPKKGYWRECDKKLHQMGIACLPPGGKKFVKLTLKGMSISKLLSKFKCIEVYPYATRVKLNIGIREKKKMVKGRKKIKYDLLRLIKDPKKILSKIPSHDELDAIISAYTAYLFDKGETIALKGEDGCIYVPK